MKATRQIKANRPNLREVEAIHHQEETTLMVVPSAAPASPAVSQVSMTSRQTHGPRTRGESLAWQSVFCSGCNFEYGQYKFDPSPGGRECSDMGLSSSG